MDLRGIELYSPQCPICAGTRFCQLAKNDRYGMKMQTVGCSQCGLVQTWPRPAPDAMADFYRNRYRDYYQSVSAPDLRYAASYNKNSRLAYTADLIARSVSLPPRTRILDVGCAEGSLFSELAKNHRRLDFVGIEPAASFSAYARQLTGCRTYADLNAVLESQEAAFDLIVVNHVLEHVDDPVDFMAKLRGLLSPRGRIYVDVPDVDRYLTPESLHIAHLFHFSERTLGVSLGASGLKVVAMSRHSPPHHPCSIWCLAEVSNAVGGAISTSADSERSSWRGIRAIGWKMPVYLFKRSFGRTILGKRARGWLRRWVAIR